MPEGKHIIWYDNGQKKSEVNFRNGKPNGFSISWYDNGQKREEGYNQNGNRTGQWTYYNMDGSLDGTEDY